MNLTFKEIKYISKIPNAFYKELKAEFLFHTNAIEGSTFTKSDIEELIFWNNVVGEHKKDDVVETVNSTKVFDKVINSDNERLNKFLLFDWHRTLKQGTDEANYYPIGSWKIFNNRIGGYDLKTAEPAEVDNLIFNLIEDWNCIKNPTIEDIARFHYKFEMIHPFQDGNGRIGRFIILKQCLENDIDLIAITENISKEYRKALFVAQKTDDVTDLVNIFKQCQNHLDSKLSDWNEDISKIKNMINDEGMEK